MLIENITFALLDDADGRGFLEADALVQTEFMTRQPGFLRRTTARAVAGDDEVAARGWLVAVLWDREADATAAMNAAASNAVWKSFMGFIDDATFRVLRYTTLD